MGLKPAWALADGEGMDVQGVSSGVSSGALRSLDLGSKISVALAKKALDTARSQGEAAIQLIQAAAETGRGSSLRSGERPSGGSAFRAGGLDVHA